MTSERDIQARILTALPDADTRLWRLPVGNYELKDGRYLRVGTPGQSDLYGLRSVLITPAHIGQRFARFLAIEVKSSSGRPTAEQTAYIDTIISLGGLAGVARSVDEARQLIEKPLTARIAVV